MKKVLEIMALALVALPLIGGNIKVDYSGPSGQGDMIFKAKATGTTNLAMGDDGIYNVTVDPNYPISGMGPGSLEITNKYMIIGNAAGAGEASSPSAVRTNLDLEIGTDVQAWDAQLDTWATVTPTVDGQALVAATDYAEMRTNLDLVVGTDVLAPGGDLTGQINSIAVATVTDGAALGATATQPGDDWTNTVNAIAVATITDGAALGATATQPGDDWTNTVNAIAVATVTDGAALGATALQPITQTSGVSTSGLIATVTFQSSIAGVQHLTGWASESAGGVAVGTNYTTIVGADSTTVLAGGGDTIAYAVWSSKSDGLSTLTITTKAAQNGLYFNTVQSDGTVVSTPAYDVAP